MVTASYCPSVFNGDEHHKVDAGTKRSAAPSTTTSPWGFGTRPSGQSGPRQLQPGDGPANGEDIVWRGGGRLVGLTLSAERLLEW